MDNELLFLLGLTVLGFLSLGYSAYFLSTKKERKQKNPTYSNWGN